MQKIQNLLKDIVSDFSTSLVFVVSHKLQLKLHAQIHTNYICENVRSGIIVLTHYFALFNRFLYKINSYLVRRNFKYEGFISDCISAQIERTSNSEMNILHRRLHDVAYDWQQFHLLDSKVYTVLHNFQFVIDEIEQAEVEKEYSEIMDNIHSEMITYHESPM